MTRFPIQWAKVIILYLLILLPTCLTASIGRLADRKDAWSKLHGVFDAWWHATERERRYHEGVPIWTEVIRLWKSLFTVILLTISKLYEPPILLTKSKLYTWDCILKFVFYFLLAGYWFPPMSGPVDLMSSKFRWSSTMTCQIIVSCTSIGG